MIIHIISGYSYMIKGFDGLATFIQDSFKLEQYSEANFLFWRTEEYAVNVRILIGLSPTSFTRVLIYGKLQWPRNENED